MLKRILISLLTSLFYLVYLGCFSVAKAQSHEETLRNSYQKIIDSFPQDLEKAQREGPEWEEVQVLNNAGLAYQFMGDYQKAIELLQQALTIARSIPDPNRIQQIIRNLATAYSKVGDYQGIDFLESQLQQAKTGGNITEISELLWMLGDAYSSLPNLQKAIEYYQEYLQVYPSISDEARQGKEIQRSAVLTRLASAYALLGNSEKQIATLQEQLTLAQQANDAKLQLSTLLELSSVYQYRRQNPSQAISLIQQAIQLAQQINEPQLEIIATHQLALLLAQQGNLDQLIKLLKVALVQAENTKNIFLQARTLDYLSRAYASLGNYQEAIELRKKIISIYQNFYPPDQPNLLAGMAIGNLGILQFQAGQFSEAEKNLQLALTTESQWRQQTLSISNLEGRTRDELNLSLRDSSLEIQEFYRTWQQILVATDRTNMALEISEAGRARAFLDLLTSRFGVSDSSLAVAPTPNLEQIKRIAQAQNSTLVLYSLVYKTNVFSTVKTGAPESEAKELYIWVISPKGTITFRKSDLEPLVQELNTVKGGLPLLEFLVTNARNSIFVRGRSSSATDNPASSSKSAERTTYKSLQRLYQLLIQPIADLLPTDPNERITFIPQDTLFLVPFAALQDNMGKFLIEKHTILSAPSIQVLEFTHQQRLTATSAQTALIVGNPDMPKLALEPGEPPVKLPPLPGSEQEAKTIAALLKTQPLIGSQATEITVLETIKNARWIHLATHGLFDDIQGFQSSLALTPAGNEDGFLTAREIINLKLNAELVVLSACDTGRGRISGDGVIGLSRSFIAAGVPSVVVSLWKVPDQPTAFLMQNFYQNLQHSPDKAQALRQAMLITLQQYPNPKDWAAFTLVGEAE